MNPLPTAVPAILRRLFLVAAMAISPFLSLRTSNAQIFAAAATLTSGGATSISIFPDQAFVLALDVTTNFTALGYTIFYQSTDGGAPFFQLIERTNTSPIHPNTGMHVFTLSAPPLGGDWGRFLYGPSGNSTQYDLGGISDGANNQDPGAFGLQTVTVLVLPNAVPGTYTIRLDPRSVMAEATTFSEVSIGGAAGPSFTVHIIPEPTVWILLATGMPLLAAAAWRSRRHAPLRNR